MERQPQAITAANAHRTATTAPAPIKAFKRRSEKPTYIRNVTRSWIPNSRTRWTAYLDAAKALELIEASTHAHTIGLPLNLSVTIHFGRGNLSPLFRAQDAIGYFLKAANQWLGLRGVPGTFIWVIEHVMGTGQHVHILLHCPPEHQAAFKKRAKAKWLKLAGMETSDKQTLKAERVGPRGYTVSGNYGRQTYFNQLKGVFKYHLKSIDPDQALPKQMGVGGSVAELLGIEPEDNQPIFGRRASQSQNISRGARDRFAAGNRQSDGTVTNQ